MTDINENNFFLDKQLSSDCFELAELPLCKLLLMNDSQYPWFILVPKVVNASEIYQLDWSQQQQLLNESSMVGELLMETFSGDKLNIAALGNMVPQLHIHHVVRFKNDPAWPKPVWGACNPIAYSDKELTDIKEKVQSQLNTVLSQS